MKILLKGGKTHVVTDFELQQLQREFPHIDVRQECLSAASWCRTNPRKRKVDAGRFLSNWMRKATGNVRKGTYAAAHGRFKGNDLRTSERDKKAAEAHMARLRAIQEARNDR